VALGGPFRTVERRAVPSGANLAAWAENSWKCTRFSPLHSGNLLLQRTLVRLTLYEQVFVKGVGHGGSRGCGVRGVRRI